MGCVLRRLGMKLSVGVDFHAQKGCMCPVVSLNLAKPVPVPSPDSVPSLHGSSLKLVRTANLDSLLGVGCAVCHRAPWALDYVAY